MQDLLKVLKELKDVGDLKIALDTLEAESHVLKEEAELLGVVGFSLKGNEFETMDYIRKRLKEIKAKMSSIRDEHILIKENLDLLMEKGFFSKDFDEARNLLNNICKN